MYFDMFKRDFLPYDYNIEPFIHPFIMPVLYTSKILTASALVDDTLLLLSLHDPEKTSRENLAIFRDENRLAKPSRSRLIDVLTILENRYFTDPEIILALSQFVKKGVSREILFPILFFLTARSDLLIHDLIINYVYERKRAGSEFITSSEIDQVIQRYVTEGKTTTQWSPETTSRASQHSLSVSVLLLLTFIQFQNYLMNYRGELLLPPFSFIPDRLKSLMDFDSWICTIALQPEGTG